MSTKRHLLPEISGAAAAGLALVAIAGWGLGYPMLASFGAGLIPMAPSTALLFVLLGLASFLRNHFSLSPAARRIELVLGWASVICALVLLILSSAGIHARFERPEFLITHEAVGGIAVGFISPVTALCFAVIAVSFLVFSPAPSANPRRTLVAFAGGCITGLTSVVLLLAYLLGTPLLYDADLIPPALPTCLGSLFLSVSLLASTGVRLWPPGRLGEAEPAHRALPFVLAFLVLVSGILTIGYSHYRSIEQRYRLEMEHHLQGIGNLIVRTLVQWRNERLDDASLFHRNASFSLLVKEYLGKPNDSAAQSRLGAWMKRTREALHYDRVSLLDAGFTEHLSYPLGLEKPHTLPTQRPFRILRHGDILLQDFYRDERSGRVRLGLLVPILDPVDSARVLGILSMRIDPEQYLYPLLKRWPTPSRTGEILLIRRDGSDVLYLNDLRFQDSSALALRKSLRTGALPAAAAVLGQEGVVEGVDYHGIPVLASLHSVPGSPWFLVAKVYLSEVYEPLRERMWTTVFLCVALLAGAAAGVGLAWRQQRSRFYREKYRSILERAWLLDIIARSLNEIYAFDPETLRCRFLNAGAQRNIGYTAAEMAGLTLIDLHPPLARESALDTIRPLLDGSRQALVFQAIHQRKDASQYPVEIHLQSLERPDGAVLLAVVTDITERRQAEELIARSLKEKELLLKEVHHRVKNNMQVISSILHLQSYNVDDQKARSMLAECQDRIRSMSMVHEHLYKAENLADISFRGYIANLAEELFRSYAGYDGRIQLKIDVDPQLSMNLDTAIPCGLIVNELASNALKHAFPQPRGGVLTIGLHRLEDGRYRLRISDDGIGVPEHFDVIKTKTLGFQLVEALVEELHGTMRMKSGGGTGFDLEFRELKYKQRMQREEAV